jgi:hypothetical protein
MNLLVQLLERLQLAKREVFVNNDYEIAVAICAVIAHSEGTLQICSDQVVLQRSLRALDEVRQNGV